MTNTFIAGVSIRAAYSLLQISNLKPFGYANFAAPTGNYFLARASSRSRAVSTATGFAI
jgi:hypothetical protein